MSEEEWARLDRTVQPDRGSPGCLAFNSEDWPEKFRNWQTLARPVSPVLIPQVMPLDQHIIYQSDVSRHQRYHTALLALRRCEREIRHISRKWLSKSAFSKLVARFSTVKVGYFKTRPETWRWKTRNDYVVRYRQWRVNELVPEHEWLVRMVARSDTTTRQRIAWVRRLDYLRRFPDRQGGLKRYREGPYWFITKIPRPPVRVPVLVKKRIRVKDWDRIRLSWIRAHAHARKLIEPLEAQAAILRARLRENSRKIVLPYNRATAWTRYVPLEKGALAVAPRTPAFLVDGKVGVWPYKLQNPLRVGYAEIKGVEYKLGWAECAGKPASEFLPVPSDGTRVAIPMHHLRMAQKWNDQWVVTEDRDCSPLDGAVRCSMQLVERIPNSTEIVDLAKRDPGVDAEGSALRARNIAASGLLAGDLRRDALEFNYVRSLGELKDTPQTVRAGQDFIAWWQSRSLGLQYFRIRRKGARLTTCTEEYLLALAATAERKKLARSLMNRTKAARSRVRGVLPAHRVLSRDQAEESLAALLGLKSVKRKFLKKTDSLKTVASLYLSYKFAIEPTVGDINNCVRNGYHWATAIRRGLGALAGDAIRRRTSVTLRRSYSESIVSPRMPRKKRREVTIDYPEDGVVPLRREFEDLVYISPHMWASAYAGTYEGWERVRLGDREVPVVRGANGIYPCPSYYSLLSVDGQERLIDALAAWHLHEAARTGDLEGFFWRLQYYYVMKTSGYIFGKYRVEAIRRALESTVDNRIVSWHPVLTTWELAPLSFVTEWFSDLRQQMQVNDNIVNAKISEFRPEGQIWKSERTKLWTAQSRAVYEPEGAIYKIGSTGFCYLREYASEEPGRLESIEEWEVPTSISIRSVWSWAGSAASGITLSRSPAQWFRRCPLTGLGVVPQAPRLEFHMNMAKASSLALIVVPAMKNKSFLKKGLF